MTDLQASDLLLQRAYRWEKERANQIYLTQPMGNVVRDWTWAQAMDEARRVAAWLKAQGEARGWEPGARIALMSKNTAWWIMSDLAIWMAGYVTVPIYPNLVPETVRQILEHSETRLCVVGRLDDWDSMRPGIPAGLACLITPLSEAKDGTQWDDVVRATAPMEESPTFPAEAMATIIYTSGTTGMPKGAMHGFGAFAHAARSLCDQLAVNKEERMFSYLPLAHVAERAAIESTSLRLGARVFFNDSMATFMTDLRRARPTFFFSVPRLWVKFQQGVLSRMPPGKLDRLLSIPIVSHFVKRKVLKQLGLDYVRFAGTGAAPLPSEVLSWYHRIGLELLECYGMTENFGLAVANLPGQARVGYVGVPVAHCEVKLSDAGEVLTRGPAHMLGYFKEPEKTREALTEDGWLRSGDLGQFDEQGRLRIVGRAKEQFKTSKGKYVSPAPIENKLSAFSRIEACMVTGVAFAQPFALVMLPAGHWQHFKAAPARDEFDHELEALVVAVNAELDPHERLDFVTVVPEQWTVEAGFITPTLKLKRNVLEAHYAAHFETWAKAGKVVVWHEG